MLAWFVTASLAAPTIYDDVDQQIIVWGDPFLRWDQRFYVETEIMPIVPIRLPAYNNHELRVVVLQMQGVLDCDRFATQGIHQLEVRCQIEDIALRGMAHRRDDEPRHFKVLPELDATLTGLQVELQVTDRGRVFNLGLEGMEPIGSRTRHRQEVLRQMVWYLLAPFDLKLPKPIQPTSRWTTYHSPMFSWPSEQRPRGSAVVNHFMNRYGDHLLVQTIGRAHVEDDMMLAGPRGAFDGPGSQPSLPFKFDVNLDGVALFDPETGILEERIYAINGRSTASSVGSLTVRKIHHRGSLRLLGRNDRPDVGSSGIIARDAWAPIGVDLAESPDPSRPTPGSPSPKP